MQDRSDLLARLTKAVADTSSEAPLVTRLCTALVEIMGCNGGFLSVELGTSNRAVLCATDELADRLAVLQDVLHEGPSLDAHRLQLVVTAAPEELPARWPQLAQAITSGGPAPYLLAIPMRPLAEVFGVVTLHGSGPLPEDEELAEAQFLTDAVGVALAGGLQRAEETDDQWFDRDQVNQAVGMVVAQLRIRPDDALALLRAHAFTRNMSVSDIAGQVVSGALDFQSGRDSTSETHGDE